MSEQMTARQRVKTAMAGGIPDRVPVFPVITKMHTSRIIGKQIRDFVQNPDLVFQAAVSAWKYYGFDGFEIGFSKSSTSAPIVLGMLDGKEVLLGSDGAPWAWVAEDDMPIPLKQPEPLVRCMEDVNQIQITPYTFYLDNEMLSGAEYVRKAVGDGAYLAGVAAGQTMNSLVAYLGTERALIALYEEPELVEAVMDRATDNTIEQAKAWKHADVDGIYFGDAWSSSSIISPATFEKFCLPRYKRFVQTVHDMGLQCYLHICGNASPLFEMMADTGTDGIEPLDPLGGVSVADAKSRVGSRVCLKGGINTLSFLENGETVYKQAKQVLEDGAKGGGFILGSGDDIPRDALPEAVLGMVRAAKQYIYNVYK